ncbi:MAG: thioredoxin family protein [Bacteroidales bacterium]|nr:MAG: thioredoxin family protein [Bacteroidales bacterium]
MKIHYFRIYKTLLLLVVIMFFGCNSGAGDTSEKVTSLSFANNEDAKPVEDQNPDQPEKDTGRYKVTFIELGSVRCIPCQQMQPVMKSIEENYKGQVKVVFYDVWTPEGRPFADQYNIQVIPTQVFLDEKGEEYYRHQGFFPEEEIIELLKTKGVK